MEAGQQRDDPPMLALTAPASDGLSADSLREEVVNMGIGIVVPVDTVLEILDQPKLREPREEGHEDLLS